MFSKAQFIEELQSALPDVFKTKVSAEKAFDAFCTTLADALKSGKRVRLSGVGTLAVKERASRTGRNPQTGQAITIPAKKVVKFNTSKDLDEDLN